MGRVIIKAEEYQLVGRETEPGLSIELSQYDLPREVEARFDRPKGVVYLIFKYTDQEEAVSKEMGNNLKMNVGRHSGKILGFEIPVSDKQIRRLELQSQLDKAIESTLPTLRRFNQKANYKVVKSILDSKRDPIFGPLALAGA